MGANLFLGKEMEKSLYLYNFIKMQGAPDAIEIIEPTFNDVKLFLYYFGTKEVYTAELNITGDSREWIVRGPRIPNWRDLKALKNIIDLTDRDAPFMINGQEFFFPQPKKFRQSQIMEKAITPTPIVLPKMPPKPVKKYTPRKQYTAPKKVVSKVSNEPKESFLIDLENLRTYTPINSDKMAIAMSKGYARRDNNGNVIHIVKSYTETLQAISNWYTGSAINAIKIEQASNLQDASNLKIGDKVIVPFGILSRVKQMPY